MRRLRVARDEKATPIEMIAVTAAGECGARNQLRSSSVRYTKGDASQTWSPTHDSAVGWCGYPLGRFQPVCKAGWKPATTGRRPVPSNHSALRCILRREKRIDGPRDRVYPPTSKSAISSRERESYSTSESTAIQSSSWQTRSKHTRPSASSLRACGSCVDTAVAAVCR